MADQDARLYTAFLGLRCVASGPLPTVAAAVKAAIDAGADERILIFADATGRPVELDLRGPWPAVQAQLPALMAGPATVTEPSGAAHRGPGRPKLGVVAREITLLPRHWEWLSAQPGGASVALRKLVEEARKAGAGKERVRAAQEAAYAILAAVAGDLPGFEEAIRALFAAHRPRFEALVAAWPGNLPEHARRLAAAAFPPPPSA